MRTIKALAISCLLVVAQMLAIQPAHAALYDFSTHTFTACGATGRSGPVQSDCISSYSGAAWVSNSAYFSVTGGIQSWKVPGSGTYTIDLYGAKGGQTTQPTVYAGGQGARVRATVTLTEGQVLKILVGQVGGSFGYTGGGGGGTYLYNQTTSTAIAVAGGGGGAGNSGGAGYNASLNTSGTTGYSGYPAGSSGNGSASDSSASGWGMSGAGINGNGNGGASANSYSSGANALSFINGGTGADQSGTSTLSSCVGAWGGFGGGGGGACNGGGGGGGYSGGASGGGGGGSYVTGTSTSIVALTASEYARIVITASTPIVADAIPPTITGPGSSSGSTSSISIAENSTSVTNFTASETVTWTISGTDSSFFSIGSSTGTLTISARDFETKTDANGDNVYIVVITATDGAANATSQTLSVTITNVNEAPTITTNSSAATYSITQAENISLVVTYAGSDVDTGTTLSYSISGTDAGDFTIGSATGILRFAQNPDFESPTDSDANNIYICIVTLSDGALTDTQTVTLTITDVNEASSSLVPTLSGAVSKGAAVTISLTINVTSRVMFYANGKRIPTCKYVVTSGTYPNNVATCLWKPAVSGPVTLTATITPVAAGFSASTSPPLSIFISRRTNTR